MAESRIQAVIEIGTRRDLWAPLPPEPWPGFVRLWAHTPSDEVAMLVAVMSSYGGMRHSSAELRADFPHVLPGGLAIVAGQRTVSPSCCCGLETWREWSQLLSSGQSPWMGHDPSPLVRRVDDEIHAWEDGGLSTEAPLEPPIAMSVGEFERQLDRVENELRDFLVPLRAWLNVHAPRDAAALVEAFDHNFVRGEEPPATTPRPQASPRIRFAARALTFLVVTAASYLPWLWLGLLSPLHTGDDVPSTLPMVLALVAAAATGGWAVWKITPRL